MCKEPVTFGGGIQIEKFLSKLYLGLKHSFSNHSW